MAANGAMIEIQGDFYSGQQSQQQAAVLQVDSHGYANIYSVPNNIGVANPSGAPKQKLFSGYFSSLEISSRLGNTPRYLNFYEGQKFETRENDQIDTLLQQFAPNKSASFIHRLESRWRYVFSATVLVIAWFGVYGIPLSAKAIAGVLPDSFSQTAGEQTLTLLDKDFLQPSELDDATKDRVRQHFAAIMQEHQDYNLTLLFRDSDVGANAFALPDGTIVFTDDMINLSENDDELLSVMAHEVGHVVHQHGMRGVIQGSILGFLLTLMTGDAAGATEYFASIPGFLTQLGYSRAFEREADDYALAYMADNNIELAHFSRLMSRIQSSYSRKPEHCHDHDHVKGDQNSAEITTTETADKEDECDHSHAGGDSGWQKYLSTHPSLQERLEKFDPDNAPNG